MTQTKQKQTEKDLFGNSIVSDKDNVYLNKKSKDKKDLSGDIKIEHVLEIVCKDANEQEQMYNLLIKKGFTCRILTL